MPSDEGNNHSAGNQANRSIQHGCAGCLTFIALGLMIVGLGVIWGSIERSPSQVYSHHEVRQNPNFFLERGTPEFHPSDPNLVREKTVPYFVRTPVYRTVFHTPGERLLSGLLGIGLAVGGFIIWNRARKDMQMQSIDTQAPQPKESFANGMIAIVSFGGVLVALWAFFTFWNDASSKPASPMKSVSILPEDLFRKDAEKKSESGAHVPTAVTNQQLPITSPVDALKLEAVERPAANQSITDEIHLKSTDGREIRVKILAVSKTTVIVRRDDGQEFEIPLERLSADSVERIDAYRAAKRQ